MTDFNVIGLTKKLISFDTSGPEGAEEQPAKYLGKLLSSDGFTVRYHTFAPGRLTLIAEKGLSEGVPPVVLTGHLDTVPLGAAPWRCDPFAGEISDGKLFGRGASDMKGGVAAMVCAARKVFSTSAPKGGVRLLFTAAEEPGCLGAKLLAESGFDVGRASAIIVGEPTSNLPFLGHKGGLYMRVAASGKAAHSSMPELGDNAIYKAARAITRVETFQFNVARDSLHGLPTINVGRMSGGENFNSVPDHAEFTIDIRTTAQTDHRELLEQIRSELGTDVTVTTLADLSPVSTAETAPFVSLVFAVCGCDVADPDRPKSLAYLTDGAILQQLYNGVPTVILGPGEPEQAHRTDEFCLLDKLEEAVTIYTNILLRIGEVHT